MRNKLYDNLLSLLEKIAEKSVKRYKVSEKNLSVPTVHTYGDFILHLEYSKLREKRDKKKYTILTIKSFPAEQFLPFFFPLNNKNYKFYDEKIFLTVNFFIKQLYRIYNKIFSKNKNNLSILFEHFILTKLNQKFCSLKFYKNHKLNSLEKKKIQTSRLYNDYYFLKSYLKIINFDYAYPSFVEMINLRENYNKQIDRPDIFDDIYKKELLQKIGITKKFVCLFLRPYNKDFSTKKRLVETDPRSTNDIDSYRASIKYLKDQNFDVVLVGRNEKNSIIQSLKILDYSTSNFVSPINDLYLYKFSEFSIMNAGGPCVYPWIFDKPCLILNSTNLFSNIHYSKYLFHPKKILNLNDNKFLKLSEIINNPIFFEQGCKEFKRQNLITQDIDKIENLESVKYFYNLYKQNNFDQYIEEGDSVLKNLEFYHLGLKYSYSKLSNIYKNHSKN